MRPTLRIVTVLALALIASVAYADGLQDVGMIKKFPKAMHSGAPVEFQLWRWGDAARHKEIMKLSDGMKIPYQSLPTWGLQFRFQIQTPHDSIRYMSRSTDSFLQYNYGPVDVPNDKTAPTRLYQVIPDYIYIVPPNTPDENIRNSPPQVSKYYIAVEATLKGKSVARSVIVFDIVDANKTPRNTQHLKGKTDFVGNKITWSKPVELAPLNETPTLRDNDYPLEPQHAYNVVNFERFPPFSMPKRFIAVWGSVRFSDENQFGGPLNRGFNVMSSVDPKQDNLPIRKRSFFTYPGSLAGSSNDWYQKDPKKYADLKAWADHRSAFVLREHAYELGRAVYLSCAKGGWGPYDSGIFGWDEEEMWPTGKEMLKKYPDQLPKSLDKYKANPNDPGTEAALNDQYIEAWGNFVGNTYRGAKDAAKERGRALKIWHYGSKAPGEPLFLHPGIDTGTTPSGKPQYEDLSRLWSWFQKNGKVDFTASEYCRQIDCFNKDFYYHVLFPEKSSMYEKDKQGKYVLNEQGRRKMRGDVFEEKVYTDPVKIGHEDCHMAPIFLKSFIAKGENAQYWLNGGKYYKKHGTFITDKQLLPAMRPGNQETWGEAAKLGSRPVSPYMTETAVIYTYMMGLEGFFLWDSRGVPGAAGQGSPTQKLSLGEMEFTVKGMHRVSQFNSLFEGEYCFVRPMRHYDTYNSDHPLIRGIINDRYLVLAMTNPYLDPSESQIVELCYDAPFGKKTIWSDKVTLKARKTHLFQCKLPELPDGEKYDPDKLYFRYTCVDGKFKKSFTVTGNYEVAYPYDKGGK